MQFLNAPPQLRERLFGCHAGLFGPHLHQHGRKRGHSGNQVERLAPVGGHPREVVHRHRPGHAAVGVRRSQQAQCRRQNLVGGVVGTHSRSLTQTLRGRQSVAAPPTAHDHVRTDRRESPLGSQRFATGLTPQRSNSGTDAEAAARRGGVDGASDGVHRADIKSLS